MPDIQMAQGDTYIFDVFATRGANEDGSPKAVDLTGAKVWFTVKKNRRDADVAALIQHDSTDGSGRVVIQNAVSGVIRIKLIPADTVNLPVSYYPYDVQVKEADNTVSTPERGFLELDREVTKATA